MLIDEAKKCILKTKLFEKVLWKFNKIPVFWKKNKEATCLFTCI